MDREYHERMADRYVERARQAIDTRQRRALADEADRHYREATRPAATCIQVTITVNRARDKGVN